MKTARMRPYAKWRLATLVGVHLLFIAHFIHWKLKGRTLAPLEFNEVLYTIHQGIVTAGFILMALVMAGTLIFGRFFCSWGCHILALQDAAGWLMDKLGIKRQPIRSRTLVWLPLAVMFYLFIWPQIMQAWHGLEAAPIRVVEAGGSRWSSFTTDDMWRNLPPPGVAVFTFFVCGFLIVYLLGSRGFCFQACPYGALFSVADQFAPGRIVLAKDCSQCGLCTKACSSDILVHRELAMHGMVTNPRCLKDLDCMAACPEEAVQYGFRKPALFWKGHPMGAYGGRYGFTIGEDMSMFGMFMGGMFLYRGLYDAVPFLLAVALSLCTAYLLVLGFRFLRKGSLQLRGMLLKMDGHVRPAGGAFALVLVMLVLFLGHSAYIQYHTHAGLRYFRSLADAGMEGGTLERAIGHYERALAAGLLSPADREQELAALYFIRGDEARARVLLEGVVTEHPTHIKALYRLGRLARDRGDLQEAMTCWGRALQLGRAGRGGHDRSELLHAALDLGALHEANGGFMTAHSVYLQALDMLPGEVDLLLRAGALASRSHQDERAIAHYEEVLAIAGSSAMLHNNLGALYLRTGRPEMALPHIQLLAELTPGDARVRYILGALYARTGRRSEAREQWNNALRLNSSDQRTAVALDALNSAEMALMEPAP